MKRALAALFVIALTGCGGSSTKLSVPDKVSSTTTTLLIPRAKVASFTLPAPVSRPAVAANGSQALLLGGLTAGDVSTNSVVSVDMTKQTATKMNPLAAKVHDAGATWFKDGALVFAGGNTTITNTIQQWMPAKSSTVGKLSQPRADLVAVRINDKSFVIGGTNGKVLTTEVESTVDGVKFSSAGALAQGVRYPAVAVNGTKVWLFGGETQATESAAVVRTDIIQTFDTANGEAKIVGHLPQALSHAMAFILDGKIFIAGGRDDKGVVDTIASIDQLNATATPISKLPFAISDAGVAVNINAVYLFGGEVNGPTDPRSSVIVITP